MGNTDYIRAHRHSSNHRKEILETEWIDEIDGVGQTALCPKCNIDSVIGSKSEYPINRQFLELMRQHWFGAI